MNLLEANENVELHPNEGDLYKLMFVIVDEDAGDYVAQYQRVGARIHYREFTDLSLPVGATVYVYFAEDWLDNGPVAAQALASVRVRSPEDEFAVFYTRQRTQIDGEFQPQDEEPESLTVERSGMSLTVHSDGNPLVTFE